MAVTSATLTCESPMVRRDRESPCGGCLTELMCTSLLESTIAGSTRWGIGESPYSELSHRGVDVDVLSRRPAADARAA
jgi:hypothetical protein